jgi:hypothetical protein
MFPVRYELGFIFFIVTAMKTSNTTLYNAIFDTQPLDYRESGVLKLLKLRWCQYLQRVIRGNIRTSILCSN